MEDGLNLVQQIQGMIYFECKRHLFVKIRRLQSISAYVDVVCCSRSETKDL